MESFYDPEKGEIGLYKFDMPIGYSSTVVQEYPPVNEKLLWKHMLASDALATVTWNHTLVVNVFRDCVVSYNYTPKESFSIITTPLKKTMDIPLVVPAGYMPTYQRKFKYMAMHPFIVYGIPESNIVFFHGDLCTLSHEFDASRFSGELYQEVLKSGMDIAYYGTDGRLYTEKLNSEVF